MKPSKIPLETRGNIAYHYKIDRGQFFSNFQYKKVIWAIWLKSKTWRTNAWTKRRTFWSYW